MAGRLCRNENKAVRILAQERIGVAKYCCAGFLMRHAVYDCIYFSAMPNARTFAGAYIGHLLDRILYNVSVTINMHKMWGNRHCRKERINEKEIRPESKMCTDVCSGYLHGGFCCIVRGNQCRE